MTARATSGQPTGHGVDAALPPCCRGWIAEETHRQANAPRRAAERHAAQRPAAELAKGSDATVAASHPAPR